MKSEDDLVKFFFIKFLGVDDTIFLRIDPVHACGVEDCNGTDSEENFLDVVNYFNKCTILLACGASVR